MFQKLSENALHKRLKFYKNNVEGIPSQDLKKMFMTAYVFLLRLADYHLFMVTKFVHAV